MQPNDVCKYYVLVLSKQIVPRVLNKEVGEEASFHCPFDLGQWMFNDGILPRNTKVWFNKQFTVLKIFDINVANHGIYSCTWSGKKHQHYYDEARLIVVQGKLPFVGVNFSTKCWLL